MSTHYLVIWWPLTKSSGASALFVPLHHESPNTTTSFIFVRYLGFQEFQTLYKSNIYYDIPTRTTSIYYLYYNILNIPYFDYNIILYTQNFNC